MFLSRYSLAMLPHLPRSLLAFAIAVAVAGFSHAPLSGQSAETSSDRFVPAGTEVGTLDIPAGLSTEEVREVLVISVFARDYTLQDKGERHVVGYLNHRGHEATLSFVIRPNVITIYCEGYAVNSRGERRRPEVPHGWINNLRNDITKRMALKLVTK